jgi:hypothetical protein
MITGGRDYTNRARVYQILDAAVDRLGLTELIHGDCPTGADALGKEWAIERGIGQRKMPADWDDLSQPDARIKTRADGKQYDANAGHRRNQKMVDLRPDHVIGFLGGPGTRDALKRARKAGIEPKLIDWNG